MWGRGVGCREWYAFQDAGRVENFAIRREGRRYLMGCGHYSFPGKTVCERGCLQSPNWTVPLIPHPEWDPVLKRAYRKDHELERRLRP